MGFGWALTENMVYDDQGHMVNPTLRNYRIPAFADVPASEVFLPIRMMRSARSERNRRASAQSIRRPRHRERTCDATGVRFAHLPFTPDRIFERLGNRP